MITVKNMIAVVYEDNIIMNVLCPVCGKRTRPDDHILVMDNGEPTENVGASCPKCGRVKLDRWLIGTLKRC